MIVYRVGPEWAATVAQIEAGLDGARFVECGATQEKSVGWCEPRGQDHGPLVESVGGQLILKLMIETRALPGSVVTRKAKERVAQIEASTGRKPGKKEIRDLKDDIRLQLLPQAFTKQAAVGVWIDPKAALLVIDASSQSRADEVVTLLVQSLDGFAAALLDSKLSPTTAMADWLITQKRHRASASTANVNSRPPTNPKPWCATPATRWTTTRCASTCKAASCRPGSR